MNPPSTPAQSRSIVAVALAIALTASCFLLGTVWTVRSEARDSGSSKPAPGTHSKTKTKSKTTSYFFDDADDFSYAVVEPGSNTTIGSTRDTDRKSIRRLIESRKEDALWFSLENEDYVVTDPATVERARAIVTPLVEHGRRQGELGAEQGKLGARQARIGAQQAKVGSRQAALAALQVRGATRGEAVSQARQAEIDRAMEELSRMQEELSGMQEPLARQQEEMGRRQEVLGRQMEDLSARVRGDMRKLCGQAIRDGVAERAR